MLFTRARAPVKSALAPSVLLSRVKSECDLSYRHFQISSDVCVQGWSLSCVKSNTIITVSCTICVAACVLGLHIQLTDMQPSEEVYDHLADVRTGPERLATFSRSHSWVGKKNSPSTSPVLTVGVGRGRNGNTEHYHRTSTAAAPSRLLPTWSWALWAAERDEQSPGLGLGGSA